MEGCERAIGLGDAQRRVIEQHDPAGADADVFGGGGGAADEDFRHRGGNRGHAVMLGIPEPCIAQPVGLLRQQHGFGHGLLCGRALGNGGKVLHGQVEWRGHDGAP